MQFNIKTLFFSPTNGTNKIVTAIATSINANFTQYDITLAQNRTEPLHFNQNDLVIIGMPTYAGRLPKLLVPYLKTITATKTPCICVTTYGNRDYEDALLEQVNFFTELGFIPFGAATFVTEHSATSKLATNRPDSSDLKIAADFGTSIASRMNQLDTIDTIQPLSLPGSYPYVEKNLQLPVMLPETNENCVTCGICAKHCPTASIDFTDCKTINPSTCIKCNSCVKRCPFDAKAITHVAYQNMQSMLIQNFSSQYKHPELFLG